MTRYNPFATSPPSPPTPQSPPTTRAETHNAPAPQGRSGRRGAHPGRSHRPATNPKEALERAMRPISTANYPAIIEGFVERGIPAHDIKPRENVFTYDAWRALGRQVRKGEKSVRVTTWIPIARKSQDPQTGETIEKITGKRPHTAFVFHISQTDEATTPKSTRAPIPEPAASANPPPARPAPVPIAKRPTWLQRLRATSLAPSQPVAA